MRDYKDTPVPEEADFKRQRSRGRWRRLLLSVALMLASLALVWLWVPEGEVLLESTSREQIAGGRMPRVSATGESATGESVLGKKAAEDVVASDLALDEGVRPQTEVGAEAPDAGQADGPSAGEGVRPGKGPDDGSVVGPVDGPVDRLAEGSGKAAEVPKDGQAQDFSFYTVLPNYEVVIPEEDLAELKGEEERPSSGAAVDLLPRNLGEGGGAVPASVVDGRFLLQVAAFRDVGQAESLLARLQLLGFTGQVVSGAGAAGQLWHRVRLGPYGTREDALSVKRLLDGRGLSGVLLRY